MIELKSISKKLAGKEILNQISLQVGQGRCLALLGPSGCGKTTLLRIIAGFEAPDQGEVLLAGVLAGDRYKLLPPHKRNLGMVFQDLALWPHMTVQKHLDFMLGKAKTSKAERQAKIFRALKMVQLEDCSLAYPHQLSGGEKQRLALARALITEPAILLFDEPLSSLDSALKEEMMHEVRHILRNLEMTTVYVTHDKQEAFFMADQIAIMEKGQIKLYGPIMEFLPSDGEGRSASANKR
jgi:ABC-type Fe3+/spermidine/putrescine transport system ATPase subunit